MRALQVTRLEGPAGLELVDLPDLAPDAGLVVDAVGREPVYLILAMTSDQLVRMKPQNLLTGLPIKHLEAAT